MERSGRISLNMVPIFLRQPHCRKAGIFLEGNIGSFATMLKGGMCSGDSLSIERGR